MSALRNVLVVDDDPVVRKSFDRVLSGKGYIVTTAENAHEALRRLSAHDYDVVFTDLKMPGMNGLELTQEVKTRRPWTPVVIVTGYGSQASEEQARTLGVTGFLHKPLTPQVIEESAASALCAPQQPRTPAAATVPAQSLPDPATLEPAPAASAEGESFTRFAITALAAPLIGLAYVVLLPVFGLGWLAAVAAKFLYKRFCLRTTLRFLANVALFFAAPLIGLAYCLLMPFVGLAVALRIAGQAFAATRAGKATLPPVKHVASAVAAPFIGLAYIAALPVAGLALLAWTSGKALATRR